MISYPVMSNKVYSTEGFSGENHYDLLYQTFRIPKDFKYNVYVVTDEYVARPDLLSLHVYGTVNYADVLCKLNGISNPFELNDGMYIVAPDANDIPLFYTIDHSKEDAIQSGVTLDAKKLQKKKNETRKANEQVVGDRNFRIDRNSKIVIY